MTTRILIVDDEEDIRSLLTAALERTGYACIEAELAEKGLEILLGEPDIGIVLIDIKMPGMNGLEFIAQANRQCNREIEYVVMSGHGGVKEAVQALRLCASDFLLKPFQLHQVRQSVANCVENLRLKTEQRDARQELENELRLKNARIDGLVQEVDVARAETLETLAIAAEHRDNETGAHIRRIGAFSGILAKGLGWSSREIEAIQLAALLHDVGKIGVPDSILLKPGKLDTDEIRAMQTHTEIGCEIVSSTKNEIMHKAANIALSHHERWDGTGYPRGLRGKEIPAEARIVAICDVYDALRSARPYKQPISHSETVAIILEGDGRTMPEHFDPEILSLFRSGHQTFAENYDIYSEEEATVRQIKDNT